MNMRKLGVAAAVGLGLAGSAGAAEWTFQDDAIDFLFRGGTLVTPNGCAGDECNIVSGDVILAVFEYTTFSIDGVNQIPSGQQITGVAAIQIDTQNPATGVWTYKAPDEGLNYFLGLGTGTTSVTNGDAGEGAVVAIFQNLAANTNPSITDRDLVVDNSTAFGGAAGLSGLPGSSNCTSVADCITEGSQGDLIQVDGFGLDPNDMWQSLTGNPAAANIFLAWNANQAASFVDVQFGLSTFYNTIEPVLPIPNPYIGGVGPCGDVNDDDLCVQTVGSSNVAGGATAGAGPSLENGAFAHALTISQNKVIEAIPAPGSLALLGLGLFGLAGVKRRKSG